MQSIIATIKPGEIGTAVANLQDALLALLERHIIRALEAPNHPTLEELQKLTGLLKTEREKSNFGDATRQLVFNFQLQNSLGDNLYGVVEEKTAAKLNEILKSIGALDENIFIVRGTVQSSNGQALGATLVKAFDRDLRTEQLLGITQTNDQGHYEIRYTTKQFAAGDATTNAAPDLSVRVYNADDKVLVESTKRSKAGREESVDLVITAPALSEWVLISQAVLPLLIGQGPDGKPLPPWELNDKDIPFIVEETGLDREQVMLWITAASMSRKVALLLSIDTIPGSGTHNTPINTTVVDNIEWIMFYGWFRDGQPQDFAALVRLGSNTLLSSLDCAVEQRYIPAIIAELKARVQAAIDARQVSEELKPASAGQPASFGDAFKTMPQSEQLKLDDPQGLGARIVSLLLKETSNPEGQWQKIHDLVDDSALFNGLRRSVGLMQLTDGYVPLMAALQLGEVDDVAAALADLVKHDSKHWIGLARELGTPSGIEADSDDARCIIYGRQVARKIELMHPAPYIKHRLLSGQIPVAAEHQEPFATFLAANPSMRVRDGSVLVWLESDNVRLGGLSDEQIKKVTPELLRIERIARLAPSLEYVGPLLKYGYESARDIVYKRAREVFVEEVQDIISDKTEAGRIYDAATGVVATTEAVVLTYSPKFGGIKLPVMPSNPPASAQAPQDATTTRSLTNSANFQRLFGSQDYCECAHGASLYGPAAYLADLLQMLARGPKVNSKTALDILLERRPDLAEIDLTADNADITLPYIDLVLELLESPDWETGIGFRINRNSSFDSSLDSGVLPQELAQQVASWGLILSNNLTIGRGGQIANRAGVLLNSWLIRDQQSGLKVRLIGAVYTAYRLRANPQSVTGATKGYRPWSKLVSNVARGVSDARFPWALPYDGVRDEANAWLEHLGVSRAEMMEMIVVDRWNDIGTACEYLNISPAERTILVSAPVAEHEDWGFSALSGQVAYDPIGGTDRGPADWHVLLKNVSLLRSRTRLTHRELLNVLETRFVRDNGSRFEITGDECNTAEMRLESMNAALARRIHIFVRLWRKLGWSTSDLDRAIYAYGIGTNVGGYAVFTDQFLRFVANIVRLQAFSKLSVPQLLDLFGTSLDTTEYWNHAGALPLRTLSRYEQWFDNPALGKPRLSEFQLNAAGNALYPVVPPTTGLPKVRISDHLNYVAAALAMPESELSVLLPTGAVCVRPVQVSSTTEIGAPIEVKDSLLKEIEVVIGAISTGATFSLLIQSSEDGLSFIDVPATELQAGTPNPLTINPSTQLLSRFTYTGSGKYLRGKITPISGSSSTLWITVRVLTSHSVVSDELSLANLAIICRYAVLRRLTGVSIKELRLLMTLSGASPLSAINGPEKVLALLDSLNVLSTLGLSISQADQLLRGPSESAELDLNARAEAFLTSVRAEAQVIRDESTVSDDKRSVLLKSVLTGIGWDERLIADVLGPEGLGSNFGDYVAPLDTLPTLPAGTILPAELTYVVATKRLIALRSTRPDTLRTKVGPLLTQVSGKLLTALQVINDEANRREALLKEVQAWMRARKLPIHQVNFVDPAPRIQSELPTEWKARFYYDQSNKTLCLVGWITASDKARLKSFEVSPSATFADAVDSLYQASLSYSVVKENLLTVREGTPDCLTIEALLLDTEDLEARCGLVLESLLPAWRRQKLHTKLCSALSSDLGLPLETAEALLELPQSAVPSRPSFELLITDAQLLSSDPATKPTRAAFRQAFDAAARLLVLRKSLPKLKIDSIQLPWLGGVWSDLDLTNLPVQQLSSAPTGAWISLMALSSLITLRDNASVGVSGLQKILAAATTSSPIVYTQLAAALGCNEDTLRVFASANAFNIGEPAWFRDPQHLLRLANCLELTRQLGMPASIFEGIKRAQFTSRPALEAESEVQSLRQMALGKSTGSTWSDAERKVLDGFRQRRRDATVDYLVQILGALDANDLYGHYLIDPQMNPCMMTSRIKQAISSVQLFIQRCLMNLEPEAPPHVINKQYWKWMKNYRVWEANRKVLLYPENWIEPELRDDKTPFFDDVVSSLQQGDAMSDKAQTAVQAFLEKLTDLSRVDVVATCSNYDDDGHLLITHVFARTLAEPHAYWYRQFRKQDVKNPTSSRGIWTPWQPVDLDIEGDHLFPFFWQGRLFLFWAIFSEKAEEPSNDALKAGAGKPEKYLLLKLAWSEYKSGKWTSRRISDDNLLMLHLDVHLAQPSSFYFSILASEAGGITINVYWLTERTGSSLPKPLDKLRPFDDPVSTLYFDGNNVRIASVCYKYSTGINQVLTIGSSYLNIKETPIEQRAMTVSAHKNMKVPVYPSPILSLNNGNTIQTQTTVSRLTQLLYSPEQGKAVFSAPSLFENTIPSNARATPFIQSDWMHQFFVYPTWQQREARMQVPHLHYYSLDWPQATYLRKTLSDSGIDKLLSFDSQVEKQNNVLGYFLRDYPPLSDVVAQYPDGDLEFSPHSATAPYNWELFFHVPFSIACSLSKNQRFEEARRWFHYLFNPTDNSGTSSKRYWNFRPFREAGQGLRIDELVRRLADPDDHSPEKSDFQTLIDMWKDQPFQPHLVARMRIRSYMYVVVMKYLDNLIAWGDQLFRRETLEALNEATQLYILAAQILGRRPEGIPRRTRPVLKSFAELSVLQPDDLSNALVEAENLVPSTSTSGNVQTPGNLQSLYFCVPNNSKLLEYYERVEDRLFKLRNCRNIDGVVRQLPLFEPAIDPSLLIRAAAAGVDVATVLADLNAPLPFYRFNVMAQKATELCSEVKALGAALLSAIEKNDAETLALMRSGHEFQMLQSVRLVKELQLHEAKENIDALGISLESAQKRFSHYIGLISQLESLSIPIGQVGPTIQSLALSAVEPLTKITTFVQSTTAMVDPITMASMETIKQTLARTAEALSATLPPEGTATDKVPMSAAEKRQLSELKTAHDLQQKAMDQRLIAQVLAKIPDFTLGAQGWSSSPVIQLTLGGTLLSSFANFSASILDSEASEHTYRASLHSTLAGYQRRAADWLLQAELAAKDIEQITKQIAASNLRIAIASQELRNHDFQIENAHAVDEFMHSKYSNRELYNWLSGQLSNLYFQSYQLAYDVAKRAERCFKHELGVDSTFIKFGYWDNLKKGFLAGENLLSDLKRMEVAYLNQNARELEITKHVSLRQLSPNALLELRSNGACEFEIPEWLFDIDFPGHYFRRIKSASVSLPCVVGQYTSLSGTLTLLKSTIRVKPARLASGTGEDTNLSVSHLPVQSIATSSGQNDSGMFEFSFRDERYLPFEGAGVISTWRFTLPREFRAFNYETISDLILHVKYTARDGGDKLRDDAIAAINTQLTVPQAPSTEPLLFPVLLSCRSDFSTEWARAGTNSKLEIPITRDLLPYWMDAAKLEVLKVTFANLTKEPTSRPEFNDATWPVDKSGVKYARLGVVIDSVTDVIVLLTIGKQVTSP